MNNKVSKIKPQKRNKLSRLLDLYSLFGLKKKFLVLTFILSILYTAAYCSITWLVGFGFDTFFDPKNFNAEIFSKHWYWIFIVTLIFSQILTQIFSLISNFIANKIVINFESKIRITLYEKIQKMPISYFENAKTGDLMSALTNDIYNITQALSPLIVEVLPTILFFVVAATIMFLYSPLLSIIVFSLIIFFLLPLKKLFKTMHKNYKTLQEEKAKSSAFIEEIIDAIPLITLHQKQKEISQEFEKLNKNILKPNLKNVFYWNTVRPLTFLGKNFLITLISIIGLLCVRNNFYTGGIKPLTFGILTSFTMYIGNLINHLLNAFEFTNTIQLGFASIERVENILNLKPPIDQEKLQKLNFIDGKIKFKNVDFAYPSAPNKTILKNINFEIKRGEILALVGATGSGKTTISKLLSKFYVPTNGNITIDEQSSININEKSWRNYIAIVSQDIFLFEDTIKNNLLCVNSNILESEFLDICKQTQIDKFIDSLPEKYETKIEHNGSNFSVGQKQLISLVRAIVSKKPIIIFDEATANIDSVTEEHIQNIVQNILEKTTILIIAHRLNTIKNAHQILLVKNGEIIERGTHQELINLKGEYNNLYSKIKNKEDI